MSRPLTDRQREVLELIQGHLQRNGAPPTIRELKEALQLKSLRGVTVHLDALVKKGYIDRSRNARGIRVLEGGAESYDTPPVSTPTSFGRNAFADVEDACETISIPVVGRIAAGQPILAEENIEDQLMVDPRWIPGPGCFSLRVRGQSMIGAGINDGDYIVVRPQPTADNGEIVAVLIEGEATVKRYYDEGRGRIRLQPENPAMDPILVSEKDKASFQVLGKVVGVFRQMS